MNETREPSSVQGSWNEILRRIDSESDVITTQLEEVNDRVPQLASAFRLLLAYTSYSNNKQSVPTVGYYPPPPPGPGPIPWPEGFAERNPLIVKCAQGDPGACQALGPSYTADGFAAPMTCEEIWDLYLEARQREIDALRAAIANARKADRVVFAEEIFAIGEQTLTESQRIWQTLVERGCVAPSAAY
jgi:hypothetical protein